MHQTTNPGRHGASIAVLLSICTPMSGCTLLLDPEGLHSAPDASLARDAGIMDASGRDAGVVDASGRDAGDMPLDSAGFDATLSDAARTCTVTADCDDGLFCNGVEDCDPMAAAADARGCVVGTAPCDELCDDVIDACVLTCTSGVPRLGVCRRECATPDGCVGDEACVQGACLPPDEACGGCLDGVCPAMTACRASAGTCDLPDVCDGTSDMCRDARRGTEFLCRASLGGCDLEERCGGDVDCPADVVRPSTFECRPAAGGCDVAERCDGTIAACPDDAFAPNTMVCNPALGLCDAEERCSGTSATCPPDVMRAPGTLCRAAPGGCDLPESCTGTSVDCPIDAVRPSGFTCRAAAGLCDVAETCDGTDGACPANLLVSAGVACRLGSGDSCDPDERCSGAAPGCPADVVAPSSFVCRAGAVACDPEERCSGVAGMTCPADTTILSCPGATACMGGTCRLPSSHALVFISSADRPNSHSLAQTDALCQSLADARRLGGTFVALMSDDAVEARDRVLDRAYYRIDDVRVAASRADMFDGVLEARINLTEGGATPAFGAVMTGSRSDGTRGNTCANWTATGDTARGHYGLWNDAGFGRWISINDAFCFGRYQVICIQAD